jgi:pimeloyl-ACP methyl ester carboxylesterase
MLPGRSCRGAHGPQSQVVAHPIAEYRVDTPRLALSVRDHAGGEPAILALHGLASNARWWDLVADQLVPAYRVIAVDLPGHGQSDRPDDGYDFDTVSADLEGLLAALRHPEPLVVVGHSWGATVALTFAANYPALTLGVICIDGGAGDLKAYFGPSWAMAEKTMRPPALSGITPAMLRAWMDSSPLRDGSDPDTAAAILGGNFEDDGTGLGTLRPRLSLGHHMQIAHHLFDANGFDLMAKVQAPMLFIPAGSPSPEDSPKVRSIDRAREVVGDRARFVWIDGVHDLPVQRPVEVAAAIAEFVESLAAQPSSTSQK